MLSILKSVTPWLRKAQNPLRKPDPSVLVQVAKQVDGGEFEAAQAELLSLRPTRLKDVERRLTLVLWMKLWRERFREDTAALDQTQHWFDRLETSRQSGDIWPSIATCEAQFDTIGGQEATRSLVLAIWNWLPDTDYGLQYAVLSKCFLGGDTALLEDLFEHLLKDDRGFVPDYWQYQTLARRWSELGGARPEARVADLLERAEREELTDLFDIYRCMLRQTDVAGAFERAADLTDPVERERLAGSLLGASQPNALIEAAVALHAKLSEERDELDFMQARLAIAQLRWEDALALTGPLLDHRELRDQAVCLRALALAHLGDHDNARAAVEHVRFGQRAPWFLKGRAAMIGMTRRLLEDGGQPVEALASPALAVRQGLPMAQALWIGPRLRWIEELSMKSYLLNGWRYKLYVYDPPENVPEGVELADAASILPRDMVFTEGDSSGAHKGSLGAFSDLFRYALIHKRGGMWTDTDVVNLRRFDPDGVRMIASEWTDAGLVGPNGAMMAAPAGDPLQRLALETAQELLRDSTLHFARIGPELLAELLGDLGAGSYRLLPPQFLNPIGWMEVGRLMEPYEAVRASQSLDHAHNLHLYTETWRTIGLGVNAPPEGAGFLPTLYRRMMEADRPGPDRVREIIAA
ncbi:Glycosyltransferase sugar-binding region containing DXD motif-containing protein [Pseudooceanicola antarcticus]|uniref:Glycosyltransferase sugar-binding region containing DXD motif-containing protein n=1 Tax=Pseudooceanicola antarcticus TaxID=1247613 RepID=A0A285ISK9_9RHOB|nr:glycosyltransferase [Pseudooceanicola antarcticus]SNY50086.1 Glycosyltransferase sugar-binding region containing DXD motif-containing protein [Pseudooceanicola antarcticus]